MRNNQKAFTLIELLVVIAIIGVITTIAVVSIGDARAKSRDAKRVADVKQIQTALELFRGDANRYPTSAEFVAGANLDYNNGISTTTYIRIPEAPTPADGICSDNYNNYTYQSVGGGTSYRLNFCLGGKVGSLDGGRYSVNLDGFTAWTASSCNDIEEECDASCPIGSICGGGTLFSVSPNLVAAPSQNSESGCVYGQSCAGLTDNATYVWGPNSATPNASSTSDGRLNVTAIRDYGSGSLALYPAAKACDDLNNNSIFGFYDWYFPAKDELFILASNYLAGKVPGMSASLYWSSYSGPSQPTSINAASLDIRTDYNWINPLYVRCVRRF